MPSLSLKLKRLTSRGFTLIELMIAMTILLIMLAALATILLGINRQFRTQRPRLEAVSDAQLAVDTITRLIRTARNRPTTCQTSFVVSNPTPYVAGSGSYFSQLRLQSDWNPADCALTGTDEDVTISVSNGNLYLDAAQSVPFVSNIAAVRFQFFNGSNVLMTSPHTQTDQIARIQVEIQTAATDGTSRTITSGATIRK